MTIVLDNLPPNVTEALAAWARIRGKSMQEVATDMIIESVRPKRDLSKFIGTMTEEDARAIEEAVRLSDEGGISEFAPGEWDALLAEGEASGPHSTALPFSKNSVPFVSRARPDEKAFHHLSSPA